MSEPLYVEAPNGRLYEIIEVTEYPRDRHGREVRCNANHPLQRVEIIETVLPHERPKLVARALGLKQGAHPWKFVPVLGRVA